MQSSWNFASWAEPSRAGFFRAEPSWQSFRSELSRAGVFKKWAITSWSRAENSFINNKVFQVNTSKGGGRYWKVGENRILCIFITIHWKEGCNSFILASITPDFIMLHKISFKRIISAHLSNILQHELVPKLPRAELSWVGRPPAQAKSKLSQAELS